MRILITGGTGLIGSALCANLLGAGHELTVLSRDPSGVKKKCGIEVSAISSLDDWREDQAFDAVINLAGEPILDARWTASRRKALWDSRVTLTEDLVKRIAQAKQKPTVLLTGSAIGYYGDRGDQFLDETSGCAGDFAAQLCDAWERAARAASSLGVRVCYLRTGLVLSRNGGLLGRLLLPFKFGLGAQLGDGRQWMSWIHIDDYVAAVRNLLDNPLAEGPINMTSPNPTSNREFTAALAHELVRPAWFVAPGSLLRLILGPRAELLLGGQRALPKKLGALDYHFMYPELGAALQAIIN